MEEIAEESNIRSEHLPKGLIKQEVELPRSIQEWDLAESDFKFAIDLTSDISNIDSEVATFQSLIYNYFKGHCGLVKSEYELRYGHLSKLKKALRELRSKEITCIKEIKYISKLLRRKFKTNNTINDGFNHNVKINNNFQNYYKETFESKERVLLDFDESTRYKHFKNGLKLKRKNKYFEDQSWLKRLNNPTTEFDQSPPTYTELTKIIKKMISGASPCPLDQITIKAFQKSPALQSQLLRIIYHCWKHKVLPSCWRNAVAALAYKKGSLKDPSNFRPISLEPVLLKFYHSVIREFTIGQRE